MRNNFQYPVTSRARDVRYVSPPAPPIFIDGTEEESAYEVRHNGVPVTTLDWGDIWLNQQALYRTFDIVNTGQTPLIVSGVSLTEDSHFSIYQDVGTNVILPVGETISVVLTVTSEVLADLGYHAATLHVNVSGLASKSVVNSTYIAFYMSANGDDSTPIFINGEALELNGGVPENTIFEWELKIHNAEGRYPLQLDPDLPVEIGNYFSVSSPPATSIDPETAAAFTISVVDIPGLRESNIHARQINPTFQSAMFLYGESVSVTLTPSAELTFEIDTSFLSTLSWGSNPYGFPDGSHTTLYLWVVTGTHTRHLIKSYAAGTFTPGDILDFSDDILNDSVVQGLSGPWDFFVTRTVNALASSGDHTSGNSTLETAFRPIFVGLPTGAAYQNIIWTSDFGGFGWPDFPEVGPIPAAIYSDWTSMAMDHPAGIRLADYQNANLRIRLDDFPPPDF